MSGLLSVKEALNRILDTVQPKDSETVPLNAAGGRVLTAPLSASRTQPPFPASAMDGYAVRGSDIEQLPCRLKLIGESAAGHGFDHAIGPGDCVRIFTGAPVPDGADTIIIQEHAVARGDQIEIQKPETVGRYIRPRGMDFQKGDTFFATGYEIDAPCLSLAAAMNLPDLNVFRRPAVAIIATGDELVLPGDEPGPDQIVASNGFGVAEIVRKAGGEPIDLGIAVDTLVALDDKIERATDADIVITLGGASVGDHDLVQTSLKNRGVDLDFWKLAMRPGKPVMFGKSVSNGKTQRIIGLPGNPVSSLVCSLVFVVPLIRKLTGRKPLAEPLPGILTHSLAANDQREEYLRGTFETVNGVHRAVAFDVQDSSLLSLIAQANCLIIRPAFAPASDPGAAFDIIPL